MRRRALTSLGFRYQVSRLFNRLLMKERLKCDNAHQRAYSRTIKTYCDFSSILIINSIMDV